MTNPFLTDWHTPHGLPPFDQITDADFKPAFEATLAEARAAVVAIAERADAPSFANTIEALERAEAPLSRVLGVFYSVAGADSNETREALTRDFGPQLAGFGSEVSSNTALFARVEALWEKRDDLGLTDEQMRVLKLTHRGFVRSGAKLTGKDEARHKEIMQRLSVLGTKFTQNLLAAERDWVMELAESDLEGLPDFVIAAARAAGKEKGSKGPVITTSRSLITPFLMFSPKRDLREKAYEAFAARGEGEGDASRQVTAARVLENADLAGIRTIRVEGARNARTSSR